MKVDSVITLIPALSQLLVIMVSKVRAPSGNWNWEQKERFIIMHTFLWCLPTSMALSTSFPSPFPRLNFSGLAANYMEETTQTVK